MFIVGNALTFSVVCKPFTLATLHISAKCSSHIARALQQTLMDNWSKSVFWVR